MNQKETGLVIGSSVGAVGTATAAVLGVLCCAGPAVAAVLGAGGALAAARLQPLRPYLLGAAVTMTAYGLWRIYWPKRRLSGEGACASRVGRRAKVIVWIATVATAASFLAPRFL